MCLYKASFLVSFEREEEELQHLFLQEQAVWCIEKGKDRDE